MWSIHTMKYYLAIKKNDVPAHMSDCNKLIFLLCFTRVQSLGFDKCKLYSG